MLCFPASIGAIGNRCWGSAAGSHWLGALVMAFAKIVEEPHLWQWFPVIFALVLFFRAEAVDWWITAGTPYWKRLIRSLFLVPLPISLFLMGGSHWHLAGAIIGPLLVALAYWLSDKQKWCDPVELGELGAGAIVGIV